ncbi:hypothetical protein ACE6H2_015835 [Prunus campanulata]
MKAQTNNYNDNEATCYKNKDNDNNYKSTTTATAAAPELDPNYSLKSHAIITILITYTLEISRHVTLTKLKIRRRRNSKSLVATSVKMSSTMSGSNFIPGPTVDGGRIFRNLAGKASVAVKNLQLRFSVTGGPMRGLFGGLASFEGGDQNPIGGNDNRHRK